MRIYHLTGTVLKLEDVWVSRRSRWWAVLSAQFLGPAQLRSFIASEHPAIPRDVLPSPLSLVQSQLDQLVLHSAELEKFLSYEPNLGRMFLKLDGKAPAALRRWSSQVTACPCGCRAYGFSHETLSSRGLYGVLVPLPQPRLASDSSCLSSGTLSD